MRTLPTLLLLALICLQHMGAAGPVSTAFLGSGCCRNSTRLRVPPGRVKDVAMTPSRCDLRAVVIRTVCEDRLCIDADWTWAKNLLRDFKNSAANNMPPSARFNRTKCEQPKKP